VVTLAGDVPESRLTRCRRATPRTGIEEVNEGVPLILSLQARGGRSVEVIIGSGEAILLNGLHSIN